MYTPKAFRPPSLLWFLSGVGLTNTYSRHEGQRRGMNCEMVVFTASKNDVDRWAEAYTPGYKPPRSSNRAIYLN